LSETVDILEFDFSSAINGEKFKEFFGLTYPVGMPARPCLPAGKAAGGPLA